VRVEIRGALVVAVGSLSIGFLPLFGPPGYEQSLAAGLLVPSATAITAAMMVRREAARPSAPSPLATLGRGALLGVAYAAIAYAAALVHGLLEGFCGIVDGTVYFLLTAAAGAVLGGAWGVVAGELTVARTRKLAVLLAIAAPLANALTSVLRFFTSPIIFAFDPFVGFFSGTLYDTVIDANAQLLTYRAGSLATLGCAFFFASLLTRDERGRAVFDSTWGSSPGGSFGGRARLGLGALCLLISLGITSAGSTLGHWQTASTIKATLGGHREGARCTVVYPAGVRDEDADLLLRDCEEELADDEATLGLTPEQGPPRVTAYFFKDAAEKRRLMGAADTYIAKPWRDEVYLQLAAYPHPVLGHELAHVVSGSFGQGPFHIAGAFGGLWPNPGMIEGVAVATSPDDDELTDAEWARAMMDLGILPPIGRIFSFGFLGESSAKSYTIAGAFVRFLLDTRGPDKVRAWYGGATPEDAFGASLTTLDAEFRASLAGYKMSAAALDFAKAKFARPSVFGRICPHDIDATRKHADACRDGAEYARAADLYRDVLARDPHDWAARQSLGALEQRFERGSTAAQGTRALEALAVDPQAPVSWRERAGESVADQLWLTEPRGGAAAAMYRQLAARAQDEDRGRTLDVKALAAADPTLGAVRDLLVGTMEDGTTGRPADPQIALPRLGMREQQTPPSLLVDYLLAKNLIAHNRFADAAPLFDRTLSAAPPSPQAPLPERVRRESFRERAIAACVLRDEGTKTQLEEELAAPTSPYAAHRGGRYDSVRRLLARCR
jgi:tetratricopeptide (TPR) repeat protein